MAVIAVDQLYTCNIKQSKVQMHPEENGQVRIVDIGVGQVIQIVQVVNDALGRPEQYKAKLYANPSQDVFYITDAVLRANFSSAGVAGGRRRKHRKSRKSRKNRKTRKN
jgi:hypothetical protein